MSYFSQTKDGTDHSKLYFATEAEVQFYNAALKAQAAVGLADDRELSIANSNEPVNASCDRNGAVTPMKNADDDAFAEADAEDAVAQAAE